MADAISVHPGDVLIMVGTRKGSFLLSSGPDRRHWQLSGPPTLAQTCFTWPGTPAPAMFWRR